MTAQRSYLSHLECSLCRRQYDAHELQNLCNECQKPLIPQYDLNSLSQFWDRESLCNRPQAMWRYRELLPYQDESKIVSLGEPFTPLLKTHKLGGGIGLNNLWVKDETALPTSTFKARGLAMAVTRAVELGVKRVAIPSAGNAAEALSVYAARAGLEACGWFDLSTFKEPYRVEGKKTMGLELAEQMGWKLPEVIIYPTGGGTGLVGMWKAFDEMEQLGWIGSKRPRMISVQSEGCAPIVRAFESGAEEAQYWDNAATIAGGLRVPGPLADRLILTALRESGGTAIAVPELKIQENLSTMAYVEGILPSPEGVATLVAAQMLAERGEIDADEEVVLFNCGTMLKHIELLPDTGGALLDPNGTIDYAAILAT